MDLLVTTEWLAQEMGAPDLRIVDATSFLPADGRNPQAEYEAAHIPGARFLDLASLVDTTSSVPAALPRPDEMPDGVQHEWLPAGGHVGFAAHGDALWLERRFAIVER